MTTDFDDTTPPSDARSGRAGLADTYRSWPQWARIMAPVAAVILGLALVSGLTGGAHESGTDNALATAGTTTTERQAPREPSTTEAPPTTAPPTLPPTTPPSPPPTTAPPTTVAPPPPPPPAPAPAPPDRAPAPPPPPASVSYANCTEARQAGAAPLYRGDPGYAQHLDRDNDGIACE